jgi:tetratricopeptide (TPR) repeat protein
MTGALSERDRGQLEQKELARGAWREGNFENALLIIRSVLSEEMSPQVAAECYSAEAGFLADLGDFRGSLESLRRMAPFLEYADIRIQGTFYNARGRAHKNLGDIDAAITDYTGALAFWQECGDRDYLGAVSINIAELYLKLGDLKQADLNVDRAIEVLPRGSEYLCNAYDTKAKILLENGQFVKALGLIEEALDLAGDHGEWQKRFKETREQIVNKLQDVLIPLIGVKELDDLKVRMVRRALEKTDGSLKQAADMLGTSRQAVTYIADHNGLERMYRKKSIIKPLR